MLMKAWRLFVEDSHNRGIRYSYLRKPIPTAPYENRQNVTTVRTEFGQSWYSWLETSPWGQYGDPIPRELFDLRTRDLNISEKELHVYFICVACAKTTARCRKSRGKKDRSPISDLWWAIPTDLYERSFARNKKINLYAFHHVGILRQCNHDDAQVC